MRKLLLASALAAAFILPAAAQVGPGGSVVAIPARSPTYSAAIIGLAPAANATDFFTLTGAANKVISVKRVACSGISTAAATATITARKRSTANTGGTATAASATVGGQIVPHDSNDPASTATVQQYTANPTLGTLVGVIRAGQITTDTAATSTIGAFGAGGIVWEFAEGTTRGVILRGAGQVFALNANATSFSAGTALNCSITWTEVSG